RPVDLTLKTQDGRLGAGDVGAAETDLEGGTVGNVTGLELVVEDLQIRAQAREGATGKFDLLAAFDDLKGRLHDIRREGKSRRFVKTALGRDPVEFGIAQVFDPPPEINLPGHVEGK